MNYEEFAKLPDRVKIEKVMTFQRTFRTRR